jgi:peptidoglycan-associated lipoprotein
LVPFIVAFAFLFGLTGCHRSATPAVDDTAGRAPAAAHAAASQSLPASSGASTSGCSPSPVYFAFDSHDLDVPSRSALEQSNRCLGQRGSAVVHVTGMADPRGTEEYNLALGERRARAVAGYLERLGAADVRVHSLGEETATGHDESGWARDRRADIAPQ